mgnify:CR=1 FL=1
MNNSVTRQDVVNLVLALGKGAICAEHKREVREIQKFCHALLLNTGMPTWEKARAMAAAGKAANAVNHPVVLDPVGAGASRLRREVIGYLLKHVHFTCIKGNYGEIASLAEGMVRGRHPWSRAALLPRGVDSQKLFLSKSLIQGLSKRTGAVVIATGSVDLIARGDAFSQVSGGSPWLAAVTGGGCMLSGFLASRLADAPKEALHDPRLCFLLLQRALKDYKESAQRAEEAMRARGLWGPGFFKGFLLNQISLKGEI